MRLLCVEHKEIFGGGQVTLLNVLREWQVRRANIEPLIACSPRAALAPQASASGIPCIPIELGAIEKTRGMAWNTAQRAVPTGY